MWLSVDPLAEMFPNISPYAYALLNPVKLVDPTGMAPESVDGIETKYKNKNTGEVVEVHDGKDVTVEVNDSEFAYAKVYEKELNGHINGKSYPALLLGENYDNIVDKYETFYYETRYGDRLTRYQDSDYWLDSGPKFRRSLVIGGSGSLEFIAGNGMKAVKYSPEVLKTLVSTEKGAQAANKISEIGKAMKAGDPYVFAESIKTYTYKGKTYILDGHHRIQAAIKNNLNVEAINYKTQKAMELFKDKVTEIHKGLH